MSLLRGERCSFESLDEPPPPYDDGIYSPGSNYSSYSREIQYVFNPNLSRDHVTAVYPEVADDNEDYAEIEPYEVNPWDNGGEGSFYEHRSDWMDGCPTLTRSSVKNPCANVDDGTLNNRRRDAATSLNTSFILSNGKSPHYDINVNKSNPLSNSYVNCQSMVKQSPQSNRNFGLNPSPRGYSNNGRSSQDGGVISPRNADNTQRRSSQDGRTTRCDTAQRNVSSFKPPLPLPLSNLKDSYLPDPRTTWSPPVIASKMGVAVSMRGYYSNDQLDTIPLPPSLNAKLYPDPACSSERRQNEGPASGDAPPQITPFSGQLNKAPNNGIVRPVAFKPVPRTCFMSPPIGQSSPDRKSHHKDEGYGSQDYRCNPANTSHSSLHGGGDSSTSFSSDFGAVRHADHVESLNASRVSSHNGHAEGYVQTPSPSDSGVGELEAMLRERDAEINTLRNVMDKNERAIFQVYEEKKMAWVSEMRELKIDYERKLKLQQRKTFKNEQQLMLQLYKLQQEHKSLKEGYEKMQSERDLAVAQRIELENDAKAAKTEVKESERERQQTSGEIAHIKQKLKESSEDLTSKSSQNVSLRTELRNYQCQLDALHLDLAETKKCLCNKDSEMKRLQIEYDRLLHDNNNSRCSNVSDVSNHSEKNVCKNTKGVSKSVSQSSLLSNGNTASDCNDVHLLKEEMDRVKGEFMNEKEVWLEEKNKVIRYQKQLQLNYVQMFRKNKSLEAEVEQLTLELENRDMKLLALNGEESAC